MGLNVSLITVSPNTTIKSSDANTNWQNLNNATTFTGNVNVQSQLTMMQTSFMILSSGGQLAGLNYFSGSGSGTFNHGLSATPHSFSMTYAGNFGAAPTQALYWFNQNASTVQIVGQSGYSWIGLTYRY